MKAAFTLAVLGALAATPALAQGMEQGGTTSSPSYQSGSSDQMNQGQMTQGRQSHMGRHTGQHQQSSRETVRNAQQALIDQGYQLGQADGKMGPKTSQALRDFQQKQGIQANGRLDQQTLAALGVQGAPQQAQTPEERTQRPMPQPNPRANEQMPPSGGMEPPPAGGNAPQGGSMNR